MTKDSLYYYVCGGYPPRETHHNGDPLDALEASKINAESNSKEFARNLNNVFGLLHNGQPFFT